MSDAPILAWMSEKGGFTTDSEQAQRLNAMGCTPPYRPVTWADVPAPDVPAPGVPEGWVIKRSDQDKLFNSITVRAPNGYTAIVDKGLRCVENVLYMLAEALIAKP